MPTLLFNGSTLRSIVLRLLDEHDVLTYQQVTDTIKGNKPSQDVVSKTFTRLAKAGACHIPEWVRLKKTFGWCWTPVYKKGAGENVPRPIHDNLEGKRGMNSRKVAPVVAPSSRCTVIEAWGKRTTPNVAPADNGAIRLLGVATTIWRPYAEAA